MQKEILISIISLSLIITGCNNTGIGTLEKQACDFAEEFLVYQRDGDENVLNSYECIISSELSNEKIGQIGLYFKPTENNTDTTAISLYETEIAEYGIPYSLSVAVILEQNLIFVGATKSFYKKENGSFVEYKLDELDTLEAEPF